MVTHKNATQVVRNRCVNQQAKIVDSNALFWQITVKTKFGWGINGLNYQINKHKGC